MAGTNDSHERRMDGAHASLGIIERAMGTLSPNLNGVINGVTNGAIDRATDGAAARTPPGPPELERLAAEEALLTKRLMSDGQRLEHVRRRLAQLRGN